MPFQAERPVISQRMAAKITIYKILQEYQQKTIEMFLTISSITRNAIKSEI